MSIIGVTFAPCINLGYADQIRETVVEEMITDLPKTDYPDTAMTKLYEYIEQNRTGHPGLLHQPINALQDDQNFLKLKPYQEGNKRHYVFMNPNAYSALKSALDLSQEDNQLNIGKNTSLLTTEIKFGTNGKQYEIPMSFDYGSQFHGLISLANDCCALNKDGAQSKAFSIIIAYGNGNDQAVAKFIEPVGSLHKDRPVWFEEKDAWAHRIVQPEGLKSLYDVFLHAYFSTRGKAVPHHECHSHKREKGIPGAMKTKIVPGLRAK